MAAEPVAQTAHKTRHMAVDDCVAEKKTTPAAGVSGRKEGVLCMYLCMYPVAGLGDPLKPGTFRRQPVVLRAQFDINWHDDKV